MKRGPEHDLIARNYPYLGPEWTAKHLGKSKSTVQRYANRHGIFVGVMRTWVPAGHVALDTGLSTNAVVKRARADGVLKAVGRQRDGKALQNIVPAAWAEALKAEFAARAHVEELAEAGWWTTSEAEAKWRLSSRGVWKVISAIGDIGRAVAPIETRAGARGRTLINPADAERVMTFLRDERARVRRMVTVKALSIELGISRTSTHEAVRPLGVTISSASGCRTAYVTRRVADILRARYGAQHREAA